MDVYCLELGGIGGFMKGDLAGAYFVKAIGGWI